MLNFLMNITQVWNTVRYLFLKRTCLTLHQLNTNVANRVIDNMKFRTPGWNVQPEKWAINNIRRNHFKSALGGATYVYAGWDSLPPSVGGAEPRTEAQTRLMTDAQNQLIVCSLVGSHKFKPKSQYDIEPYTFVTFFSVKADTPTPICVT